MELSEQILGAGRMAPVLEWASGCGLDPVLKTARMIREHLRGIVNAIILRATNGPAEGINSRIKTVKVRSRGFSNR